MIIDGVEYVMVPREPTFEMLDAALPSEAGKKYSAQRGGLIGLYKSMIAAAPKAKPPEQGQVAAVSEALDILDRVIKSRELRGVFLDEVYKAAALLKSELARGKGGV